MTLDQIEPGDMIFATTDIYNDGSIPDFPADAQLATPGTRGVLMNTGHLEEQPDTTVYLVRFEDQNRELGPPVTCLAEELSVGE